MFILIISLCDRRDFYFIFFFTSTFKLEFVELVSTIVVVVGGIIRVVSVGAEVSDCLSPFLTTCDLAAARKQFFLISSSSCTRLHISHKFSSPFLALASSTFFTNRLI